MSIPEVGSDLSRARAAYDEHGAVIFRKALSPHRVHHLQLLCASIFSIMDLKAAELAAGEARADDPLSEYVKTYQRLQFIGEDVARTLLAACCLGRAGYDAVVDAVRPMLESALDKKLTFVPSKTAFRRQGQQASAAVTWHRDAHAVQTASLGDCLNCWVPLHPVGIDRPSLQIVVGSNRVLRNRVVDYAVQDNPSDEVLRETYGEQNICTAVLEPGDVLLFGHHTLHRTQPMPASHAVRISGELRFVENV